MTDREKIELLLIDMVLHKAPMDHMERAVKHSRVVIDKTSSAQDLKKSEIDNGIKELSMLYQSSDFWGMWE